MNQNQTDSGITTTFERGWSHVLIGAGVLLLSLVLLVVGGKLWLTDVYTAVGPSRSADVTIIAALGGVCGGVMALLSGVSVAWLVTRISRNSHVLPGPVPQTDFAPALPASRIVRPMGQLRSGNWASGRDAARGGSVTLHFTDRSKAVVPRAAVETALRMAVLKRTPETWPHDKSYYTPVLRWILEHHGADQRSGVFDETVRDRLLEDVLNA